MLTFRRCKGFDRGNSLKLFIGQFEGEVLCPSQVQWSVLETNDGTVWATSHISEAQEIRILNQMSMI